MNASSRIYNLVKALADSGACRADDVEDDDLGVELNMRKVKERVIAKGFTEDQWMNALEEYTTLDVSSAVHSREYSQANPVSQVWQTAGNGARLVFVTADVDDREDDMDF